MGNTLLQSVEDLQEDMFEVYEQVDQPEEPQSDLMEADEHLQQLCQGSIMNYASLRPAPLMIVDQWSWSVELA